MYPTSHFSLVLGTGALALAWRRAEALWHWPALPSLTLALAAGALWLRCLYGLHWRWQHDRAGLQAEYRHPSRFALLALLPITTIIIGLLLLPALQAPRLRQQQQQLLLGTG